MLYCSVGRKAARGPKSTLVPPVRRSVKDDPRGFFRAWSCLGQTLKHHISHCYSFKAIRRGGDRVSLAMLKDCQGVKTRHQLVNQG